MNKYAICMGINDYPGVQNDLSQCVNDMNKIATRLELVGFDASRLKDSDAVTSVLIAKVRSIAAKAKVGDEVVISYSGHGSYRRDLDGDELDIGIKYDEVICLYDRDFSDDEFRNLLNEFKPGVKITVILDSCFSGTATRAMLYGKVRKVRFRPPKEPLIPFVGHKKPYLKALDEESMNHILLSGCSDSEYSYEDENGGVFTSLLCEIIDYYKQSADPINFLEFAKDIASKLPSNEFPQSPQVEGPEKLKQNIMPFFQVDEEEPPAPDPEPEPEPTPSPWDWCGFRRLRKRYLMMKRKLR